MLFIFPCGEQVNLAGPFILLGPAVESYHMDGPGHIDAGGDAF